MKKMFTTRPGWVFLILAFLGFSLQTYADTEPNNTLATAENAAFGVAVSGSLNQAPVGDPDDYYLIVAPGDGDITVTADMGAGLNAYIFIYDKLGAGGIQVFGSEGTTVSVTKYCMAADTFAVRIDHYQGAGSYSFTTSIAGSVIGNDTEDNGTLGNVTQFISEGQSVTGHIGYYDTDLGFDENDYFGVVLPEDGSYTFRAIRDLGQNFYLNVRRKDGSLLTNPFSNTDTTYAYVDCLAADTVYLEVDRYQDCGGYTLSFENTTPPGTGNDIENNGSIAEVSQFISEGESVTGHIGYYDVDTEWDENDYFGVILPEDGSYTFRAIRDLGKTSQTFYFNVRRKDGTLLDNPFSNADTTYAVGNCLAADTVYIQMDRYTGCGGYTLSFENTTPPGTANDNEDNGSIDNVTQFISEGESVTGHIGNYDVDLGWDENDYFGVILPQDGSYTFRAIRDLGNTSQTFYFNVRRKDGTLLDNPFSNSDTTYAYGNCLAADTVYIQMDRYTGCGGYTLSFELTELTYANDSGDNETLGSASLVPTSSINEGHLGYYDVDSGTDGFDFYKFTIVQVPFELDVKVELEESLNAYVVLYNSGGSLIQNEYHTPGSYNYTRTITEAGDYYIGLDHYTGCGSYSIGNFCANAPEVAISPDGPTDICPGESVLLTATEGLDAYSWLLNGVEISTTQIYLATEPGSYVVTGYDVNGCDGLSEELVIGVFDVPAVTVSTEEPTTFCEGGSILLTATAGFDTYQWSNGESGQSIEVSESGTYTVTATTEDGCDEVSSNSIEVTVQVDSDSDGVCDVDDSCPSLPGEVGDGCDDGNANTDNDVINADCECEGTIMFDCPALSADIGDACDDGNENTVGDAINADCDCIGTLTYDCEDLQTNIGSSCDDGDSNTENDIVNADCECEGTLIYECPDLSANVGDSCDDGNASTENDLVTDECECIGTIVYDCPALSANIGDACDDGNENTVGDAINTDCDCIGTLTYDCEDLQANIGSSCDDGDSNTENDVVTADCECEGTLIYECPDLSANVGDSCDDGNASTENDLVTDECECIGTIVYDCPALSANIGDSCNDNNESTVNDVVIIGCECEGTTAILENTAALCSDGVDNDNDGLSDCEDPNCQAIANNVGCLTCFEDGLSFADEVIEYEATCTNITPPATNPQAALGMPDYTGNATQHVSLGRGLIKLGFTNNTLVNSGTSDADLFVFEVGPLVEGSFIELRPSTAETVNLCEAAGILDSDGDGFYEFGSIGGALASVDIDAFFDNLPASSVFFDAIKIIDGPGNCSTDTPGADIDAVCALSSVACVVGESCDDGNPDTENDVLNADCECAGTPIIVFDCQALEANFGDTCNDGDSNTENDVVTADCECEGTLIYDCPQLEANIGDACDDLNADTENDMITEDCECLGTPIVIEFDCPQLEANIGDACDDNNADTENDMVNEDCACAGTPIVIEFDCPQLEANFGDACNDGDDATGNDVITTDCLCAGTPIVTPTCEDFVYYISDHDAADGISDIYEVTVSGGVATMEYIATSDIEIHIAYNGVDNLLYAVSKHTNSYRTLNPHVVAPSFGPTIALGADYGELTAAVFNVDGKLLIGSQNNNAIYCVNVTTNVVSSYDTYSPVTGGDIAFGSDGMLYLATRSGNGLYENYPVPVFDNLIGSVPVKVTGLAITDTDELLVSAQGQSSLQLYNTSGTNIGSYPLELDGETYTLRDGDMASGCSGDSNPDGSCEYSLFYADNGDNSTTATYIYGVVLNDDNTTTNTLITTLDFRCQAIAVSPEGLLYLVDRGNSGTYIIWDVNTNTQVGGTINIETAGGSNVGSIPAAVYHNGTLFVGSTNGQVYGVNPATGITSSAVEGNVVGGDLVFDNLGDLWLLSRDLGRFYNLTGGGSFDVAVNEINGVALLPNGNFIVANGNEGSLFLEVDPIAQALTGVSYDTGLALNAGDLAGACILSGGLNTECYGAEVLEFEQGLQTNGSVVPADRSDATAALGQPDASNAAGGFVSLGVGGHITIGFGGVIYDAPGNDIRVWETSFSGDVCGGSDDESADIEVSQDGLTFVSVGTICRDGGVDIAGTGLDYVSAIRITNSASTGSLDGYDVDGVEAINGCSEEPLVENGDCYATEVVEYIQGTLSNGGAIAANRTDATNALGAPERVDQLVFVSLGYGGSLTLAFDGAIPNGDGDDIEIVETTYGNSSCNSYFEFADVYVSVDGDEYFFAKTVCRADGFVDISDAGTFAYVNFVKVVNNNDLSTTPDAFDVDGVVALHNCEDGQVPTPFAPANESVLTSFPNPTSGQSEVVFVTAETSLTLVEVYDMSGRNVATLFNTEAQAGMEYRLDFDGAALPNGVYIYRMTTAGESIINKFMIAK